MTRTPRRDARGRFLPKRRRNPTGAGYLEGGKFHPIRSAASYSPARAGDLGHDRQMDAQHNAARRKEKREQKEQRKSDARRLLAYREQIRERRAKDIANLEKDIAEYQEEIATARAYLDRAKTIEARTNWQKRIAKQEAGIRRTKARIVEARQIAPARYMRYRDARSRERRELRKRG